ncbi:MULTISPECIES: ATPase domain-containing protein [unclassified Mesorhizobium]|uniref:ATPase domain-containing protein n=2 Tax=Mesorhizobium TaxID=68287 RepID=UPI000FCBE58D|nr:MULTISPECIES: ATPase domain-containing protein [unclassified Mesorhizobium]AZV17784.1 circadian clock protein KaiC [Mesorhizobium sp. M7A.F.Ce.TU.012.03.2.1]RVD64025.1 circadian clock protein KaiC [Mesorhizobium sp. M7A.F.Ca.ET.027.03.2.1]RWB10017.1 MAG: circadian clock protein KaiC [Mesorhizobium sp.]RWB15266.1 MAG: circadian clock protein KaiC [Mesorhizobium sp.]RWO88198.1 MAG: circadian clock protein KaiC [Mesorhizobium sp.]
METDDASPITSGVEGLDYILRGGYAKYRSHLIEGRPGSGKTTLGLQFLINGAQNGDRCLYITLSESKRELLSVANRHGMSLDGVDILELVPPELSLDPSQRQTLVHSSDLELGETVQSALDEIGRLKPDRVVFDSLSEIRLLSQGSLRYRRQVLALKSFFLLNDATVLLLDDLTAEFDDLNLHSISHGVIRMEQLSPVYGGERRRLRVIKMRGVEIRGGYHDFVIRPGGVSVFPRLVAGEHDEGKQGPPAISGTSLDNLLGGGLSRGTSTLLIGPSGVGKSTIASTFCHAALLRGETVLVLLFDETKRIFLARAAGLGLDLEPFIKSDMLLLEKVEPAELSPGELSSRIQAAVDHSNARLVVIDSLTGYLNAMSEEQHLVLQMHEILTYLNQKGVVTILLLANHGLLGQMVAPVDMTYLCDSVMLLRFFENDGRLRRAISVVKKRVGAHEDTIREFKISPAGLAVGEPLEQFRGILTGVPSYQGKQGDLLKDKSS